MKKRYEELFFKNVVLSSNTFNDVRDKLGLKRGGASNNIIRKYIKMYSINTDHFFNKKQKLFNKEKRKLDEILTTNSNFCRTHLKNRLYKEGLKKRICELCGQDENWHGKKMSLILDHINGIPNDNRIENLRIVCPNCNATLETHCRGNKKISNKTKGELNLDSYIHKRKVERPSYEQLKTEIWELGYVGTGKKYGVSDNAIRKWEKHYIKYI